ncbi:hypothetical protein ACF3DV_30575 [Chlorogloeopsis fritschii PCC 9212]|uniref:PIN domain-containing protein n=1 Tax=Chlorogloeopsis fritschii PCC 6912 TaxID=211165 RepID=A0A3S5K2B5_CHLFR|nr:hypothetical protein [Chlorogloeopsis fritschii]RUR84245.1 hypothetical protein PCC6912_18390 [Chlorogloeopsis fritschii PCC 6912]
MMTNKQRFVFDTNVLISAFLFSQSKPRQALDQAQDIGVLIFSSSVFLAETDRSPTFPVMSFTLVKTETLLTRCCGDAIALLT